MQCKDIPDKPILKFLKNHPGWCTYGNSTTIPSVQNAMPSNVPKRLQLAKMQRLIARGLVNGCSCGCRGDFELTEKGEEYLNL